MIIPVLNEGPRLRELLGELQQWRASDVEIIISDGGSQDGGLEGIADLCDELVTGSAGRSRQMNRGATRARGHILLFLHVDSHFPLDPLKTLRRETMNRSECWGWFRISLSGNRRIFRCVENMMRWRSHASGIATGDQGIWVSRPLFDRVGGFPPILLMEDIRLSNQLGRHRRPVVLPEMLVTSSRRWEKKGPWRTIFLMWKLRLAYFMGTPAERLHRDYYR